MVAIFSGLGSGFERGSASSLGSLGLLGGASVGRGAEQVFFNAKTGNMVVAQQDEFLVGRGLDLAIGRTYNSLGDLSDDNRDNWRQSTDRRVYKLVGTVNSVGSTVTRVSGDGSEIVYGWNGNAYVATEGAGPRDKLTFAAGAWTWTDGATQVTETYAAYGTTNGSESWRIVEQADTDGNRLSFQYSGDKLWRIFTADGNYVEYRWSDNNNISEVFTGYTLLSGGDETQERAAPVLKSLTRVRYCYDGRNRLTTVTVDLTPEDSSVADGKTYWTTYTYTDDNRIASISQSDGSKVEFAYSTVISWRPGPKGSDTMVMVRTNYLEVKQWVSESAARITNIRYGSSETTITDPSGAVTTMSYDERGRLTRLLAPASTSSGHVQAITSFDYEEGGQIARVRRYDSDQQLAAGIAASDTQYFYDVSGNVIETIDSLGNRTTRTYGLKNELLTETRHTVGDITIGTYEDPPLKGAIAYRPNVRDATFTNGAGIAGNGSDFGFAAAPEGTQVAFLQNTQGVQSSISQRVSRLTAGARYTVRFQLAARSTAAVNPVSVTVNGTVVGTFSPSSTAFAAVETLSFVATGNDTITFTGTNLTAGDVTTAIDNVTVSPVPLVAGGSFESPSVGNGHTYNPVLKGVVFQGAGIAGNGSAWGFAPAPEGSQVAFVQSVGGAHGSIAHTVSGLVPGVQYVVKFHLAARPIYGGNPISVAFNGTSLGTFTPSSTAFEAVQTLTFTAGANTGTLTFTGAAAHLNDVATAIDNVSVSVSPSSTYAPVAAATSRYVYNAKNQLRYTVSDAGRVTEHRYKATGELEYTIEYPEHPFFTGNLKAWQPLSLEQLNGWRDGILDRSSTLMTRHSYDERGNLVSIRRYTYTNGDGTPSTAYGYSRSNFIYDQAGRLLSRHQDGGRAETFAYDGLGRMVASVDLNGGTTSIVFNDAASNTVVTLGNGFVKTSTFDRSGNLISSSDSGANVTGGASSYAYDSRGLLRMATDPMGVKTYFVYDRNGRKTADVNHLGDIVEYRYDPSGRVIGTARYANQLTAAQLAALADTSASVEVDSIRPQRHASDLWAWQVYDRNGQVIQSIEGDGRVTVYEYDDQGRQIKSTILANRLNAVQLANLVQSNGLTEMILPSANPAKDSISRNFYDRDGLLIGVLDGEGYLSTFTYDSAGQKIQETSYANATSQTLRASGTLAELLSGAAAGGAERVVRYAYDGQGSLRYQIDGLDQVTEFVSDQAGRVTHTIRHGIPPGATADYTADKIYGMLQASGSAANSATRISWSVYDSAGRLAYSIDSEGGVTRFSYNDRGQVTKSVQYAAKRETNVLPALATMDAWADSQVGHLANRVNRAFYTERGELHFSIDAEGYVTRNDYDAAGRVRRTVRWDKPISVDDSATIATVNNLVSGSSVETGKFYDPAGRVIATYDGAGTQRRFEYNANGTVKFEIVAFGLPEETRTYFVYDSIGRVVQEYRAYGTADQVMLTYGYDGLGNLITVTDAKLNETIRSYDRLGRMTAETNSEGGMVRIEYNAFGEAVKITDAKGNATYNYYDKLGRLTLTRDAEDYLTETGYNRFGDVTSVTRRQNPVTSPAGTATRPAAVDHPKDAVTRFEYDRLSQLKKIIDAEGYVESYELNAFGQRSKLTNKLGGITEFVYNRRGLLEQEKLPVGSFTGEGVERTSTIDGVVKPTPVINKFEYDARGNRTLLVEALGLPEERRTVFEYDQLDRLKKTIGTAVNTVSQTDFRSIVRKTPTEEFTYDRRGNLIQTVDQLGARTFYYYDRLNRKVAQVNEVGALTRFEYDVNGNLINRRSYGVAVPLPSVAGGERPAPPPGEYRETVYAYDKLNRMTSSSVTGVRMGGWNGASYNVVLGSITSRYEYDANGNVTKTTDGNGGSIIRYYDRLGRAKAQVDQVGYLTSWTLDAEGNVLTERRHALPVAGAVTWALPVGIAGPEDRVTTFTYDRNGRRETEQREGVVAYALDAAGALPSLSPPPQTATIRYRYNGLGQVVQKTEATGESIEYDYDKGGRLTSEKRASYTDYSGNQVRPTVRYFYDGLDQLMRTEQGGEAGGAGPRVTTNSYGEGGRLASTTDAAGATYTYGYDTAGNVLSETYQRKKSDNSVVNEGILYARDRLGRVTARATAVLTASGWAAGDRQNTSYNLYGEIGAKGYNTVIDSNGVAQLGFQEQLIYDKAGRLSATNSGDGVWRYFLHDANGNETLTIESEGRALAGQSLEQVLGIATGNGAHSAGAEFVDGITVSVNVYDRRNLATQTIHFERELSEGAARVDLTVSRGHNAFGEVIWEMDPKRNQTNFAYNKMGRNISVQRPRVMVSLENADGTIVQSEMTPTERLFYDLSGRLIGVEDANGNRTSRKLLAGTGYDGTDGAVLTEYHADGGIVENRYDVFGDVRRSIDEVGRISSMVYDARGRLTQVTRPSGLVENYAYDLLGQRIKTWNSLLGEKNYSATDYDSQGRVVSQLSFGYADPTRAEWNQNILLSERRGDLVLTSYEWSANMATSGMGTFGGWKETTAYQHYVRDDQRPNGAYVETHNKIEKSDVFGHTVSTKDLGGHEFAMTYDLAGRMTRRAGAETIDYSYFNTGLAASISSSSLTKFGYDQAGNKVSETGSRGGIYYQNATAAYDSHNRMVSWEEAGNATTPAAKIRYQYDANGNVRRTTADYAEMTSTGGNGSVVQKDYWYRYDSMNRVVVSKGVLENGKIRRSRHDANVVQGTDIFYDKAGRRTRTIQWVQDRERVAIQPLGAAEGSMEGAAAEAADVRDAGTPSGGGGSMWMYYQAEVKEEYVYNERSGDLKEVRTARSGAQDNGNGGLTPTPMPTGTTLKATYSHDDMGRLREQKDFDGLGGVSYHRIVSYNARGQIAHDQSWTKVSPDNSVTEANTFNHYGESEMRYALGGAVSVTTSHYNNGRFISTSETSTAYEYWDGAVQSSVTYKPNLQQPASSSTTYYQYNGLGQLQSVDVNGGRSRVIRFTNDAGGLAVRRDETLRPNGIEAPATASPHEVWYRFDGKQLGYSGNNGTADTDYQTSMSNRSAATDKGAFRFGASSGTAYADFDQNYTPINSYGQGGAGGSYTVRAGDTLSSIAASLWGDGSLWFKLAEANGMTAATALSEGQMLTIPAGVLKSQHNARTFKPYDPSSVIGDVSPTSPLPPPAAAPKNKCGVFGQILLVVVAVAVSLILPEILPIFATKLGGIAAAAIGSAVSQGVGVATGIQEKFDWKGVAMAAVGAGVGAGLDKATKIFGKIGKFSKFAADATRGAAASAITQAIGVATRLQGRFSWAGVAAAGVGAGVTGAAADRLGVKSFKDPGGRDIGNHVNMLLASSAGAIASAAAKSLVEGSSFGDNLRGALPGVIGTTIGNIIGTRYQRTEQLHSEPRPEPPPYPNGEGLDYRRGMSLTPEQIAEQQAQQEAKGQTILGVTLPPPCENGSGPGCVEVWEYHAQPPGPFTELYRLMGEKHGTTDHEKIVRELHLAVHGRDLGEWDSRWPVPVDDEVLFTFQNERNKSGAVVEAKPPRRQPGEWGPGWKWWGQTITNIYEGAVKGDFSDNDSLGAEVGRFVSGLNPLADARDIAANVYNVFQGKRGARWALGVSIFAAVPVLGDLGKLGLKRAGKWYINSDIAGEGVDRISNRLVKDGYATEVFEGGGRTFYGPLLKPDGSLHGTQPSGTVELITDLQSQGTDPLKSIKPAGWIKGIINQSRLHLAGNQHGGTGKLKQNLVAGQQNPLNQSDMIKFENDVTRRVQGGAIITKITTPHYVPGRLEPHAITMEAIGSDGIYRGVSLFNPPYVPGARGR